MIFLSDAFTFLRMMHKVLLIFISLFSLALHEKMCCMWYQGRIQDLKLGVAQTDWKLKNLKTGGGIVFKIRLNIYISNTTYSYISNFQYYILYFKPPYLCNIVIKIVFGKILGGARPPLNPPLGMFRNWMSIFTLSSRLLHHQCLSCLVFISDYDMKLKND